MRNTELCRWNVSRVLVVVALFGCPAIGVAQTLTGQAAAAQATVVGPLGGTTLGLANTGALSGPTDALQASLPAGNLLGAPTPEAPPATTLGDPAHVASQASLPKLSFGHT